MKAIDALFQAGTGLGQIIDQAATRWPERTAIVSEGRRLTYGVFYDSVLRLAAALRLDGVGPGEPVALISRNSSDFLLAEFAILKLGAVVVKINWRYTPDEIQYLLDLHHVHYAFLRNERVDWGQALISQNQNHIHFYLLDRDASGISPVDVLLESAPPASAFSQEPIPSDAPAFRIHTSGTTGHPKCAIHTHDGILNELSSCLSVLSFQPGMVYQMISQLFHAASTGAYLVLAVGGTLVLLSRFDPTEYLRSLETEHVTAAGVIPVVLKRLLDHPDFERYDLSRLRVLNYSTCPMPFALLQRAMARLHCNFYQSYGMTEMASVVTVLNATDHVTEGGRLNSVGKPIPGACVRIEGPDGLECPIETVGEILLRGPGQMLGYFGDNMSAADSPLRDGWYHTNDMGWLDGDGYLYLCGRKDDLIISGGENIYPQEIVDVLMCLVDDVAEAAVYGVLDSEWGERVKASVVLLPGSTLTQQDLICYCRAHMAHYKAPKEVELCPFLPKNATGKVTIRTLKKGGINNEL